MDVVRGYGVQLHGTAHSRLAGTVVGMRGAGRSTHFLTTGHHTILLAIVIAIVIAMHRIRYRALRVMLRRMSWHRRSIVNSHGCQRISIQRQQIEQHQQKFESPVYHLIHSIVVSRQFSNRE